MAAFDLHLAGVCGFKVLDHLHLGGVVPDITEEAGQDMLDQVLGALKRLFPEPK